MKKLCMLCAILFLFSSCGLMHFFHKKEKEGCPLAHNNFGAERIAAGDPKAIKAARKAGKADKGLAKMQ